MVTQRLAAGSAVKPSCLCSWDPSFLFALGFVDMAASSFSQAFWQLLSALW